MDTAEAIHTAANLRLPGLHLGVVLVPDTEFRETGGVQG